MEVTKEKMGIFLRDVFKQDPNPGTLTVRQLRTKYLEHVKLEELDSKQLAMFSSVVDTIFQEFNDQQSATNSEEDEKIDTYPRNKAAKSKKRKPNNDSSDEDDDFKPNNRKSATSKAKQSSRTRKRVRKDESLSSDDDFKPKQSSRSSKVLKKTAEPSESSSDDLPLTALKNVKDSEDVDEVEVKDVREKERSGQEDNSRESNALIPTIPEVECTANVKKKSNTSKNASNDGSSDDEILLDLKHKLNSSKSSKTKSDTEEEEEKEEVVKTTEDKNKDSGSDSDKNNIATSEDDSDGEGTKKNRKVNKKKASKDVETREESKPSQKSKSHVSDDDDPQILRMKRFIRTAGLRVVYAKVFEGCRSKKAKVQKLVDLLEEAGLKGKPTLEKCKKLRKKRETMREVAELDQSNILETTGRPRRNLQPGGFRPPSPAPVSREDSPSPVATKKIFSRLKDIVDSEESD